MAPLRRPRAGFAGWTLRLALALVLWAFLGRQRRRARAEDRIRTAKDTGLTNLPLHELDQNRIWQAIIALACEITAWTQMLTYTLIKLASAEPSGRWR